jgi:selenocysteine-specific elongation factor
MAAVSLLEGDTIEPGGWALAQLFLDEPVLATWGQPFVLRDSSAEHTLGGGQVLQPLARKIRRRHIEMLERLEQLGSVNVDLRAETVAWLAGWAGFTTADLVRGAGVGPEQAAALIGRLQAGGKLVPVHPEGGQVLLHADRLAELEQRLLEALAKLHEESPLLTHHDRQKLLARLDFIGDDAILNGAVDRLIQQKKFTGDGKRVARADFKPKLSVNQRKLKDKVVDAHRAAGFQPPEPSSFAPQAGGNAAALEDIFEVAVAEGLLIRITETIYLHTESEALMRRQVAAKLAEQPAGLTVAEIRDLLGTTRKFAIPLCEYLDRAGMTRREGDLRVGGALPASG